MNRNPFFIGGYFQPLGVGGIEIAKEGIYISQKRAIGDVYVHACIVPGIPGSCQYTGNPGILKIAVNPGK